MDHVRLLVVVGDALETSTPSDRSIQPLDDEITYAKVVVQVVVVAHRANSGIRRVGGVIVLPGDVHEASRI